MSEAVSRDGPPAAPAVVVTLGPVDGDAARAWLAEARQSLADMRRAGGLGVPDGVLAEFEALIEAWTAAATAETFLWSAEMEVARVRALASHWASIAAAARSESSEVLTRPLDDARPFYEALVVAVTTALADAEDNFVDTFTGAVPDFDHTIGEKVGTPTRVLVVDDTEDIRLLVRIGLDSDPRLEVAGEAVDGLDAIEKARELCPDAILLDVLMPRMDGITALPRLAEVCPESRIVVFSANDDRRDAALDAGADAFLTKTAAREAIAAALLGEG